jgi:hypothetical protein
MGRLRAMSRIFARSGAIRNDIGPMFEAQISMQQPVLRFAAPVQPGRNAFD